MSHRQPRDHKQSSRAFTSVLHRFSQCLGKIFHRLRVDLFFFFFFFDNKDGLKKIFKDPLFAKFTQQFF